MKKHNSTGTPLGFSVRNINKKIIQCDPRFRLFTQHKNEIDDISTTLNCTTPIKAWWQSHNTRRKKGKKKKT